MSLPCSSVALTDLSADLITYACLGTYVCLGIEESNVYSWFQGLSSTLFTFEYLPLNILIIF